MKDVHTHTMVWKMEEMKAAVHIVDSCIMTVYIIYTDLHTQTAAELPFSYIPLPGPAGPPKPNSIMWTMAIQRQNAFHV